MKCILLFDIDNTLLPSSDLHSQSFSYAFKTIYGVDASVNEINAHGYLDSLIVRDVLRLHGISDDIICSRMQETERVMTAYFAKSILNNNTHIYQDTTPVLKRLADKHILGLVTGNFESIGWTKLRKLKIDSYFIFGSFGTEGNNRSELVQCAINKAKKFHRLTMNNHIVVIGDIPRDIEAGQSIPGVKTIGITQGAYTKVQLIETGADIVVENITEILTYLI